MKKNRILRLTLGIMAVGVIIVNVTLKANNSVNNFNLDVLGLGLVANAEDIEGGSGYNPDQYYEGYYNKTIEIRQYSGNLGLKGNIKLPIGLNIEIGASGSLCYCEDSFWWWKKCYKDLLGWTLAQF